LAQRFAADALPEVRPVSRLRSAADGSCADAVPLPVSSAVSASGDVAVPVAVDEFAEHLLHDEHNGAALMRTLHLTNPLMGSNASPAQHNAVTRLQRLLQVHHFPVEADGVYGPGTAHAVVLAKRMLGYPLEERLPVAGDKLMKLLASTPPRPEPKPASSKKRDALCAYWRWGIQHEPQIHYAQIRPFPVVNPRKLPMRTDCSGYVSLAFKDAGLPDPNGEHWSGLGYTGTLLQHGRRITQAMTKPGDVVVFGAFPGHHTAGVLERMPDGDLLLASHGQEKGPFEIALSEERRYQPSGLAFITYLHD
jgi:peptidoglycan hydrolase-like protein with peptidoglycan-binding domain